MFWARPPKVEQNSELPKHEPPKSAQTKRASDMALKPVKRWLLSESTHLSVRIVWGSAGLARSGGGPWDLTSLCESSVAN
eukprot:10976577-Alexandrium_andersonii.AAC.1